MTPDILGPQGRKHRRYRKASLVWYHILDDITKAEREGVGNGFDVSRGGLGINTPRPLPRGCRLFVHVKCRDFELTAIARVTRVAVLGSDQHGIGLAIEVMSPDQRARIERMFP